jgi:hypothetical protein
LPVIESRDLDDKSYFRKSGHALNNHANTILPVLKARRDRTAPRRKNQRHKSERGMREGLAPRFA